MDPKKDIWRQFRDQADAWDEAPPASVWERLDARLDAAPPEHPGRPWKPFALPGAGLLLVLLMGVGLLRTANVETEQPRMAEAEVQVAEQQFEEAPREEVIFADTLSNMDVAENISISPPATDTVPDGLPQLLPYDNATLDLYTVELQTEEQLQQTYFSWDSLIPDNNFSPYDYSNSDIPLGNMVVTNRGGNVIDTVHSLAQYRGGVHQGVYNPYGNQYLQLNGARNDASYRPRGSRRDDPLTLSHFNWLLGSWKREGPSGATFEQWQQLNEFTIEGRGYFMVNGDTMVTEKMRIEQRGENVYYIVALDTNLRPIKFRLRSSSPGELIFENKSNEFPKEIIVRQNGTDNFSTTLNNGKRGARKRKEETRRMQRSVGSEQ